MAKYRLEYRGISVTLANKPFAGGGEGNLFAILEPTDLMGHVAKIYHEHKLTEARKKKIDYLAQYPPFSTQENSDAHPSVVWVKDALYQGAKFVGFIMPHSSGEKLEILCMPKIPRKLRGAWRRFDFKVSPNAMDMRLKLCFNICAAIHQVHATNRYILVDMKPDNIVIQPNGLVSIVDTDSVEVVENGISIFDAPVSTPEYTPPEFYQELDYDPTERDAWDRFGLGVIIYKLFFGLHPFAASSKAPFDNLVSLDDKIENGLFVHHPGKKNSFKIIPPPHSEFFKIDKNLQDLFIRCFVDGHTNPEARPTAEEWCATILLALDDEAAYKRYGHILGGGLMTSRPRFPLPSSSVPFPEYPEAMFKLVDFSKGDKLPFPVISQPASLDSTLYKAKQLNSFERGLLFFVLFIISISLTPVIGLVAAAALLKKAFDNFKTENKFIRKTALNDELISLRKDHFYKNKAVSAAQKKFKRSVRRIVPRIEKIINKLKIEIQELDDFIKKQDEKVLEIEEKALEQYKLLNKKYVSQALSDRVIARVDDVEYDSLSKIRIALNNSYKIAVNTLTKEKPIDNHPQLLKGKMEVDALVNDKKIKITSSVSDQIAELNEKQELELSLIDNDIEKDADLLENLKRLWRGRKKVDEKVLVETRHFLKSIGFTSVSQIKTINIRSAFIYLKNGDKISAREFKDFKYVLKNLWQWFDEIKHQTNSLLKQKSDVKQKYRLKIKALDDKKRTEIKGLDKFKMDSLQKVKVQVQKVVLGSPFSDLQMQHESATVLIDELESKYGMEEEEVLKSYNDFYDSLISDCKAKVKITEQKIKKLESQLEVYNKKINHPKIQKNYKILDDEIRKLKSFLPFLEKKESDLLKYQEVSFVNYLKYVLHIKK